MACMCNNTLPEFKLEDNLKLNNVAHTTNRDSERMWSMVPHGMSSMSMMKNPAKCLGRVVSHIKTARDMLH